MDAAAGDGSAVARSRSSTAAAASAAIMRVTATIRKRACTEIQLSASPPPKNPSGPASVAQVRTADITFGRSDAGVRTMITATTGAFTSGVKNENTATT